MTLLAVSFSTHLVDHLVGARHQIGVVFYSIVDHQIFAVNDQCRNALDFGALRQLITTLDLADYAKGVIGIVEFLGIDPLRTHPFGNALVVVELQAFFMQCVENGTIEPGQVTRRFERVEQLGEAGPLRAAERNRHPPEGDVGR